jgi:uncharacterized protein
MPHLRVRHIQPLLQKALRFSPVVGVLGHRQVGKTTLSELLSDRYITMDSKDELGLAERDPEGLLRNNAASPLTIDECQLAPPIFPAIKNWVRSHPSPGQFLLTGSVRFTSRKAIRESLTGRIINWELLPMDLSEAHSMPLPNAIPALIKHKTVEVELKPAPYFKSSSVRLALEQGGLPGIFSVRSSEIRYQRFETQIETLLERDLRLLLQTSLDFRSLRNLLTALAKRQTHPLELAELSRATRISPPTLRKLISALESMFVIRLVDTDGTRHKPVLFFEDQGEATHLAPGVTDPLSDITRFLFSNLRQQWLYRPDLGIRLSQLRNRGGAYVPLVLRNKTGNLGVIPILEETPEPQAIGSASSFLRNNSGSKVIFVHTGSRDVVLSRVMRVLPLSKLV